MAVNQIQNELNEAKRTLARRGWGQGSVLDEFTGKVCLIGAVGFARGIDMINDLMMSEYSACNNHLMEAVYDNSSPTIQALAETIREHYPEVSTLLRDDEQAATNTIHIWNDAEGRTVEDIMKIIDLTLIREDMKNDSADA